MFFFRDVRIGVILMHHATSGLGNPVLSSRAKMGKATEGIGFDVFEQLLRAQRCPSFEMIPIQVSTCFLPFEKHVFLTIIAEMHSITRS